MKLSPQEKKELLRLAKIRENRKAFDSTRKIPHCRTFDDYIAALDDVQATLGSKIHRRQTFVSYTFFPF